MIKSFKNFIDLEGKNIYVLGGAGLIGREIVKSLLLVGAKVFSLDKSLIKIDRKKKNLNYLNFNCENILKNPNILNKIYDDNGAPYSVINCSYPKDEQWSNNNFTNINYQSFKKNIELHLLTYTWQSTETAKYMVKKKLKGNILLFGSIYGFLGQDFNLYKNTDMRENMTYSIIKSGIINHVRQLSAYYGKYGIRVNCLSPGGLYGHIAGKTSKQSKIFIKNYSNKTPLKRLGYPEEVSKSAIFLCSSKASYITGSNLIVDGGISLV